MATNLTPPPGETAGADAAPGLPARLATFAIIGLAVGTAAGAGWSQLPEYYTRLRLTDPAFPFVLSFGWVILTVIAAAMVMDALPPPALAKGGRRRGWALVLTGVAILLSATWLLTGIAVAVPLAWATVVAGGALAICVDALRIETARSSREQGLLFAAQYGAMLAGAFTVHLASQSGREPAIAAMASILLLGLAGFMIFNLAGGGEPAPREPNLLRRLVWSPLRDFGQPSVLPALLLAAALILAGFAATSVSASLYLDLKAANLGEIPAFIRAAEKYVWLIPVLGAAAGGAAAWLRRPPTAFGAGLQLMALLHGAALVEHAAGGGGYWAAFVFRSAHAFLKAFLIVTGMATIALGARPPFTATQVALLILAWEELVPQKPLLGVAPDDRLADDILLTVAQMAAGLAAALIAWLWLRRLLPRTRA